MTVKTKTCGGYGGAKSAAEDLAGAAARQSASCEILAREDFSDVTYLLEVSHPMMARAARPGQFVIVISREAGERIPLTIADFDAERGTVTLVIQAAGKTTREMQQTCQVGTSLHAMVGPMGEPSHIGRGGKVICVGGGLGVAPVFPQARALKQNGAYVIGVVGFRNQDLVFWRDKFESVCDEFIICSDDGSVGIKGLVTDGIELAVAKHDDIDEVIAIGPPIMMKAAAETTRKHGIKTTVSLNPIMVDGTGMCGGCRVLVGDETKFACVDGPDFDGHQVDFVDLMNRLTRFKDDEALALERWSGEAAPSIPPKPADQKPKPRRRAGRGNSGVRRPTARKSTRQEDG
jgi:NAD(P)H-flavin reductase